MSSRANVEIVRNGNFRSSQSQLRGRLYFRSAPRHRLHCDVSVRQAHFELGESGGERRADPKQQNHVSRWV